MATRGWLGLVVIAALAACDGHYVEVFRAAGSSGQSGAAALGGADSGAGRAGGSGLMPSPPIIATGGAAAGVAGVAGSGGDGGTSLVGVNEPSGCVSASAGLARWFKADPSVVDRMGASVSIWFDPRFPGDTSYAASVTDPAAMPGWEADASNGKPALVFDGEDDELVFTYPLEGKRQLTIVAVASTTRNKPGIPNACCPDWVSGETGASGTSNLLLYWPETSGAGSVLLSPQQLEVAWRFGTSQEWTDPNHQVADVVSSADATPKSIHPSYKQKYFRSNEQGKLFDDSGSRVSVGDAFTWTVAILDAPFRRLLVGGRQVMLTEDPNDDAIAGTANDAHIGRGRFPEFHWPGKLSELMIFDAALDDEQIDCLGRYVRAGYGL